ncbi:MAG: DUF6288 domain-containing protein [Verrucomicrobia bacterium]|nr:DUF6288 domain-containing protein [Verrucomicrobiota bacterium]
MNRNTTPRPIRSFAKAAALALLLAMPAEVKAVTALKIDLTVGTNLSTVDRTWTYNLGPTGMRGWIDNGWPETPAQDGYTAFAPYQILVTAVGAGTPAAGILAIDDVILGASAGSGAVPLFTSDARKSLGLAIGAAEAGTGVLSFRRWRAGVTTEVSITLPVMGAYSDTAPYNCSKTALIRGNAASSLAQRINTNGWNVDGPGSINALALLATGDATYLPMLQAYARSLAPATLDLERTGIDAWSCYQSVFLAEYYMLTNDAQVFHGLSEYVIYAAKHTSMFGTAGHGFSNVPPPGGWEAGGTHGSISWYGPVNQAGLVAQLTIALGKKAGVVSSEIDPAIARAANFFGYYVNRGSIPYGEHQPYCGDYQIQGRTYYDHRSNGKDGLAAVMFACMDNKPVQTEYFSRMALAGSNGEAYGHTGQGFSYLWTMLGANMGGPLAAAEYHKQLRWDRDLKRRSDGAFVYEGGEQWAPGKAADYFDSSNVYYDNPTAYYLLHACIPLKKLHITGKNANPANELGTQAVSNATWAAEFTARCGSYTKAQLIAALDEWDPIVRFNAATELATRSLTTTEVNSLITMAGNPTNANQREAACTALGCLQATSAIPALTRRLKDSDIWVRAKAAKALTAMGAAATSAVPDMLDAFVANVKPTYPFEAGFNWNDPLQISNGYLSETLFNSLGSTTINADKSLLYPAVRAGIKQPAGMWRGQLSNFVQNLLTLDDVKALAPDLFEEVTLEGPCDRMFTMAGPYMAMSALSKYHIAEGIDLCMDKTAFWGWDAAAAYDFLKPYDETARRMLPNLYVQDLAWMFTTDPVGGENAANLDAAIARIEAATTAPDLVYGLAVALPQILVTPANTARAITLTGSSCRQATVTCAVATRPLHGTLTGTPPNLTYIPAAGYQGMDRFTFTATDGLSTSSPATVHMVVGAGGTGLNGSYFDNMDFTSLKATRIDPSVNFDWGTAPPNTLGAGTYSVRWTGQVLAPESGTYRLSTRTSDGVRLWINGVQVINDWNDQATSLWNDSAEFTLTAGQKSSLKMEYYDNANPATARLYWSMPSRQAATIIPQELLFPVTGVALASPSNGASFVPGATVTLTADVADVAGTVTNVSFYNGATLLGSDTTAPYAVSWTNVATGEYDLTAKATVSTGAVSTSTVVVITVGGNAVPVTSGLACWFDASYGVTADSAQQVTFWHDRSGNGHDAVFELWEKPVVMRNQLFSRPALHFTDQAAGFLDLARPLFVKEQYVVVRSPSSTWRGWGAFLGRRTGRSSSYLINGTGFDEDQFPLAVSKNGTSIPLNQVGRVGFNLGTITNYMVLKITVNDNDTSAASYQIGRGDGQSCEFEVTEILGYSRTLTSQEEAKVGGYLTAKYGLTTTYPATGSLANRAATGITNSSAAINATLMCNGTNYDVVAYWGPEDGGINPTNWANSAMIGSWTNVASIDLNRTLTNLAPGTTYYCTFRATNATGTIWATPAQSFTTISTAKEVLTFGANVAGSNAVIDTGAGTVAWTVPYGTDLTNLAPTYTVSPLALGTPDSGLSRNFSTPQTYTIIAEDFSTKTFTVTVTQGAASSVCDMLTFGPGAAIDWNSISMTVPYETDLATLAPAYTISGGAAGVPASGVVPTPNFATANPAAYTITAQDGITTKTYHVTITVLPFNPNRISNGSFEIGKDIPSPPGHTTVSLPSADLVGWNGNFNSWYVKAVDWGFPAQDGSRVVNLCYKEGMNAVSQTFAVSAGTTYTVSCYNKQRGGGGKGLIELSVPLGMVSGTTQWGTAISQPASSTIQQVTTIDPNWVRYGFKFTPTTTTTATLTLGNYYNFDGGHGDNDGVFMDNVSVTAAAIVGTTPSTATLARHPGTGSTSTYGTALSFDVTVAGASGTPTGTVTLKDGGPNGTTLGSTTLTNGACTITTPTLAVGTHPNIVAVYGGNSSYATSTSGALSQTVTPAPPDAPTGLTATPAASGSIILTWHAPGGATGYKISIKNTATNAEQVITTTASPYTATGLANGTSYQFKVLGTNSVGDGPYSSVVSATPIMPPSTTTLASSLGAAGTYGTAVTFTATVAVTGGPATGTVTFRDGATVLGTGTLAAGQANFTTSTLAMGTHSITASYPGDASFAASTASAFGYTVNAIPLTITGVTANNKTYDGTTAAVLTGGTLSAGVVSGETVTVTAGSGTFASANAGTWAVTASGYALGGTHAGNYVLSAQPAVPSATITARPVILTGTRVYDGTATAAAGVLSVSNNVDGAGLGLTGSVNLAARDAGAQAIVMSYVTPVRVRSATGNTGSSAATTIPVNMGTAPANGNTMVAVISTRGTSSGRVTGITQTGATWTRAAQTVGTAGTTTEIWFAPNVSGAAASVSIAQASLRSAAVVMEYSGVLTERPLDQTANTTGSGNAAVTGTTPATAQANELWIGGIGLVNSGYNLSSVQNSFIAVANAATAGSSSTGARTYALERMVTAPEAASSGGTVSTSSQWSGAIATLRAAGTLQLTGAAAGNYTLTGVTGAVQITPKALTVGGLTATGKTYDGNPTVGLTGAAALQAAEAAGAGTTADGKPYTVDTLVLSGTAAGTFADPNAGTAKPVTVTGNTLAGTSSGNYTLTQPAGLTADIAPRALTVIADDQSKTYGQTLDFGSGSTRFTSSGLQHGETIGSVTLACGGGGATAAVATYPITPGAATAGTFDANNYTITYVPGVLTVNPAPLPPYATWAGDPAQGLTAGVNDGPMDDPDHDGMTNMQEFAFGLNPSSGSSVNPITQPLEKASGRFQYTRRVGTGLIYQVLASTTLGAWVTDAAATEEAIATNGDIQTVTVHVTIVPVAGNLFVRVQAQ